MVLIHHWPGFDDWYRWVAVELTPESARKLAKAILAALEEAEADGWLSETAEHPRGHGIVEHAHAH
jgi:hypothetical protein